MTIDVGYVDAFPWAVDLIAEVLGALAMGWTLIRLYQRGRLADLIREGRVDLS